MKTISSTAIVALMTATIGLSAIAPSYAQDAAPTAAPQEQTQNFRQHGNGPRQGAMRGGFINVERGTEAVEIAFVRLSHAVELTAEQQPLFDTFKSAALSAAADFATAVEGIRPAAPAAGETPVRPDMAEGIANRIAVETAKLAALEAIQPSATAFFDSLTDAQKAAMRPDHGPRGGGHGKGGPRDMGQGGQG